MSSSIMSHVFECSASPVNVQSRTHTLHYTASPQLLHDFCLFVDWLFMVCCLTGVLKKKRENGNICRQPREDRPLWEFHCRKNERGRIMGGSTCVPCFMLPHYFLSKILGFFFIIIIVLIKNVSAPNFSNTAGLCKAHAMTIISSHT